MKLLSLFLTVLLFLSFHSLAQKQQISGQMDYNIGMQIHQNWHINSYLEQQDLPKINPNTIYTGVGIDLNYQDIFFLSELGIGISEKKHNDISNGIYNIWGTVSLGYNVIQSSRQKFKVGGVFSFYPTRLNIYDHRSSMDINNISLNNSGKTEININPISVGIMLRYEFFSNSSFPLGLAFSYNQNLNKAQWNNTNGNTQNTIQEDIGFYTLKLFIPLKKWE